MLGDKKQIIYGCMGLGGSWDATPITKKDIFQAEEAIETALAAGITFFDHADIYRKGKSELVFGKVLQNKVINRDNLIIQSKAGIRHHELGESSIYDMSKKYLLQQVDVILERLQINYLDIFLLHRPDPLMNPEEVAETFDILKKEGKVNKFGVSNMSLHQIKSIQQYCDDPLVTNQIQLSLDHSLLVETGVLVNRVNNTNFNGVEGLLEYCQSANLSIQAYSPLDGGRFTGNKDLMQIKDKPTIKLLNELSEKYKVSLEAILLAWLFRIPVSVYPVIGTTNPNRIRACSEALSIELTKKDWYSLWVTHRGEKIP